MRLAAAVISSCLWAATALAQSPDPAADARTAADRLTRAGEMLSSAKSARNRVKALSETVHAYEDGLQAMREGLRRAAIREQTLSRELQSREDEVAQFLGVLMGIGDTPAPVLLLHPSGPVGTARSAMILADVAPALDARAQDLRDTLEEVSVLRALQQSAASKLQEGLDGAQKARTALSQAIADRTDLPRRFTEDPVRTALLIASTETLEGFASGLSQIAVDEAPGSLPGIAGRKGDLPLPVQGSILRRAGEEDAAGIVRPGIVMAARPRALVTTPAAATVRYRGPLLDYGNVIILEPQTGILLVLAGLDVVYGETGQVLPGGSPVGLMGGAGAGDDVVQTGTGTETGARRTETLYIELREDNAPVDPLEWFRTDKDD
ncbi:Septal ring factor EnvC, activator of murein hydrolases AmiA and AmiB [Roseovarius pacificus]|uniref:Septal ring factor EnvC, activator of murein hydrolases AmiA and AmiB n=1 Tax=Roseovarius pacificus TaxID=337701 RepID=A0A1M7H9D8_9RHOB|nr:peptidoglycan DD-metalloendopeptidase family protein [Roseovarius pacificus]GGO58197.1 peptidase M23 [Roseovarius pacificus]SHM25029.1 Septal ring factor EnvC, activator of murein hydrolases AmiA and AmiB [Roseovarius pacificus]